MDDADNRGSPLEIRWWIRALQVRNEDVEGKVFLLENMSAVAEERPPCNLPDRCWYYTCGHLLMSLNYSEPSWMIRWYFDG